LAAPPRIIKNVQFAKETTAGTTPLAGATWRRGIGTFELDRMEELEMFEDLDVGLYIASEAPLLVEKGVGFTWTFPLDYTQILGIFLMGLKGAVTPTGGGADKTWTFLPAFAAGLVVDTYTFEFGVVDPLGNLQIIRSNYCICDEWEITAQAQRGGGARVPQVRAHFFGRAPADAVAFTATTPGTVPTLQRSPTVLGKGFLDTTWAGVGGTQLGTGQLYGFSFKFSNAFNPQVFMDGRTQLDFSTVETRQVLVDQTLDVVDDPSATSFVTAQEAIKLAGTKQFTRISLPGPALGGSAYALNLDLSGVHASDSMQRRFQDRDGILVTQAHFTGRYDATSTNAMRATVVTAATAFP
jgi:hypothetical protein